MHLDRLLPTLSIFILFFVLSTVGLTQELFAAIENDDFVLLEKILDSGADLTEVNYLGLTPLAFAASESGEPEIIRLLLRSGADPNWRTDQGLSILMHAAKNQNPQVLAVLLEADAKVNARDARGWTPLFYAASYSFEPSGVLALIAAGAEINATSFNGETALIQAIRAKNIPVMRELLRLGADIDTRDKAGWGVLDYAFIHHDSEVYELLFAAGVNPNTKTMRGETLLLQEICYNHDPEVLKLLLRYGADFGAWGDYANGALSLAIIVNKRAEIVRVLLEETIRLGGNLRALNADGSNLLQQAVEHGSGVEIVELLLTAEIPVGAVDEFGFNSFENAAMFGNDVQLLDPLWQALKREGEVVETDLTETLFYGLYGNPDFGPTIASWLVQKGANAAFITSDGYSLLMLAARRNRFTQVLELLIENGADPAFRDPEGNTAFDYAQMNGALHNTDVYWLLNDARF